MDKTEEELEAELLEVKAKLDAVRAANREAVLADVKAKIKKYSITRTELATAFPVLRRPSKTIREETAGASTIKKRRGRPRKAKTDDVIE